jgi:hypothetical protein
MEESDDTSVTFIARNLTDERKATEEGRLEL